MSFIVGMKNRILDLTSNNRNIILGEKRQLFSKMYSTGMKSLVLYEFFILSDSPVMYLVINQLHYQTSAIVYLTRWKVKFFIYSTVTYVNNLFGGITKFKY